MGFFFKTRTNRSLVDHMSFPILTTNGCLNGFFSVSKLVFFQKKLWSKFDFYREKKLIVLDKKTSTVGRNRRMCEKGGNNGEIILLPCRREDLWAQK